MRKELGYWLALQRVPGIGPRRFLALLEEFGSPRRAWHAPVEELRRVPGMTLAACAALVSQRAATDPQAFVAELASLGISAVTLADGHYPANLRRIYDPPPVLYARGDLASADENAVAIVGSRRASPYGKAVARRLAADLAARGLVVVSGLARGVDTAAHEGALVAGGRTLAVLACGLDIVYPPENSHLAGRVGQCGALVSELPPGTPPLAANFPARNRIISGLSRGVVVVEAGRRSGALITADIALEQGREVFAVPGNVTSEASEGCNLLIQQGAKLVLRAEDVLEELGLGDAGAARPARDRTLALTGNERQVLDCVSLEPIHPDEIASRTGLAAGEVASTLVFLELKGLVRLLPGALVVLAD